MRSTTSPRTSGRARESALAYLREPREENFVRMLRVNSPHSVEGLRTVKRVASLRFSDQTEALEFS
jgi:hypothetical protein